MSNYNSDFNIDDIMSEFNREISKREQTSREAAPRPRKPEAEEPFEVQQRERRREEPASEYAEQTPSPRPRRTEREETERPARAPKRASETEDAAPGGKGINAVLTLFFCAALCVCLIWGLFNINPYKSSSSSSQRPAATPIVTPAPAVLTPEPDITAETQEPEDNAEPEPVPDVYTPKYRLNEGEPAPMPNQACYGSVSVSNASAVMDVIQKARDSGLLGADETVAFNPSLQFNTGSYYQDIMYYYDESILAICWKEIIEGSTVTNCEIKIGDGSQMRMEVYGDIYDENDNTYLQQMARELNAVVAMNSDKCKARGDGVLVYNRTLYKYKEDVYAGSLKRYNCLDNCYVTGDGDFIFQKRLEEMTTDEMNNFIAQNNIIFSISFGPLLIENGEMVYGYNPGDDNYIEYAFGETEKPYSRCGIGQIDDRHYLYCSLNHSDEQQARWTMRDFANHMNAKGFFKSFYAMDGGQTAELVINDTIYNHIDYGAERYTSNCIYFATAIPSGG